MLPYDTQTNVVSSSLVWQYWVVLVCTDWYSFVSHHQLKELSTLFVTLQYNSILLSTCQYTILPFCTRCFSSSLQYYAHIPLHLSTFLFDFFTSLCVGFFGCTTLSPSLTPLPSPFILWSPFSSVHLPLLLLSSFFTSLPPFIFCLCLSSYLLLLRPCLQVLLPCWRGCRTPYNPPLVSCQPCLQGLPVVFNGQALRFVFKLSTSTLLSRRLPDDEK